MLLRAARNIHLTVRLLAALAMPVVAASCSSRAPTTAPSAADSANWQSTLSLVRTRFPEVRQVSTETLDRWLADPSRQPPVLLDVRRKEEYAVSHLHGAIWVDPDLEGEKLAAALSGAGVSKDRPIVAYCSVGYRSSRTVRRLASIGFHDAANLEGSIFKWANEGRPVERSGSQVTEVHPYDAKWGVLLDPSHHPHSPSTQP